MKKFGFLALLCLATVSCGKKVEDKAFVFSENGIEPSAVPAATYSAKSVRSYTTNSQYGAKAYFGHEFGTAGDPAKGDSLDRQTDWGTFSEKGKELRLIAEINLPLSITAKGEEGLAFEDSRYYWHYQDSDESWGWSSSGTESTSGDNFSLLITQNTRDEGSPFFHQDIATAKVRVSLRMDGEKLIINYEKTLTSDETETKQVVEIVYVK